jgi:NAD(P)H-dependent FMN reductase
MAVGDNGLCCSVPAEHHAIRVLTVCGSLQTRSANRAALDAATKVMVARGASVDDFDRLGEIPAFDPNLADTELDVVVDWRGRVDAADAVLVAAPEYAGGVGGTVKNAFDWLVGSGNLYRKSVVVISAGTSGGLHARRQLAQTLTWQGAYVIAELGIAAPRTKSDETGRLTDQVTLDAIAKGTERLLDAVTLPASEVVANAIRVVGSLGIDTAHVTPAA